MKIELRQNKPPLIGPRLVKVADMPIDSLFLGILAEIELEFNQIANTTGESTENSKRNLREIDKRKENAEVTSQRGKHRASPLPFALSPQTSLLNILADTR